VDQPIFSLFDYCRKFQQVFLSEIEDFKISNHQPKAVNEEYIAFVGPVSKIVNIRRRKIFGGLY
jgi:hypothetical protein